MMPARKYFPFTLLLIAVTLLPVAGQAENAVRVESKTVCAGARNVSVRIAMTNDMEVRNIVVPLEIRSVSGGAFPQTVKLSWDDRLPPGKDNPLGEHAFTHQYTRKDCSCAKGQFQGYTEAVYFDTLSHAVKLSPVGVLFSRLRLLGKNLPAGKDERGSMVLTFDIGDQPGVFEIVTACVCPSNRLLFVDNGKPCRGRDVAFTKGVITVEACR